MFALYLDWRNWSLQTLASFSLRQWRVLWFFVVSIPHCLRITCCLVCLCIIPACLSLILLGRKNCQRLILLFRLAWYLLSNCLIINLERICFVGFLFLATSSRAVKTLDSCDCVIDIIPKLLLLVLVKLNIDFTLFRLRIFSSFLEETEILLFIHLDSVLTTTMLLFLRHLKLFCLAVMAFCLFLWQLSHILVLHSDRIVRFTIGAIRGFRVCNNWISNLRFFRFNIVNNQSFLSIRCCWIFNTRIFLDFYRKSLIVTIVVHRWALNLANILLSLVYDLITIEIDVVEVKLNGILSKLRWFVFIVILVMVRSRS